MQKMYANTFYMAHLYFSHCGNKLHNTQLEPLFHCIRYVEHSNSEHFQNEFPIEYSPGSCQINWYTVSIISRDGIPNSIGFQWRRAQPSTWHSRAQSGLTLGTSCFQIWVRGGYTRDWILVWKGSNSDDYIGISSGITTLLTDTINLLVGDRLYSSLIVQEIGICLFFKVPWSYYTIKVTYNIISQSYSLFYAE